MNTGTLSRSRQRVADAFAHRTPDRTPLFELFQPYHPIHWDICGRNIATDSAMAWDARAEGIAWQELVEAEAQAQYKISRYFGLDMIRLNGGTPPNYTRPVKTGPHSWTMNGVKYALNPRIQMVELANPEDWAADSRKQSEEDVRKRIETWDGKGPEASPSEPDPMFRRVRELAAADGVDWVYMGEIGTGTGVAFYPPFMLMWLLEEPALVRRWLEMQMAFGFPRTRQMIQQGCTIIAMGGDVSCDKGPFISPALYHEFILPVIQEHVRVIHEAGALAVYTSDGNHWPIKDDFFFNSGIDGYKEVDKAAGMTWPRLIAEGIDRRVCIIGNMDARHTFCHGTPAEVEKEVIECLDYGRQSPGGHILHMSHSVHEDVKAENYRTAIRTYRRYFGLPPLA